MFKKPSRESFKLKSVKSKDRGSLDFDAFANLSDGAESYEIPYKGPHPIIPHPDVFTLMDDLKIRLASDFGYTMFESFVSGKNFSASAAQKKYTKEFTKEMMSQIHVTGISISGKERNKVVVTGTYNGRAINTKPLHFGNQEYGEDLQNLCDQIENEVYEYIFLDKKAQLDVAFPEEEEESNEDSEK